MSTIKKPLAGAATLARGKEDREMSLTNLHSNRCKLEKKIDANFARLRKNNTILGDLVVRVAANPPEDKEKIAKSFDAHRYATLDILDAIHRDTLEVVRLRAQELEKEKQRREAAAQAEADDNALIHRITGLAVTRDELPYLMYEAFREGKDVTPFVAAMAKLDELDIAQARVTSWCDHDEEVI